MLVSERGVSLIQFLSHPRIHFCIPPFSSSIIVITHVKMCPSIFYLPFSSFHLSALKIAANGWDVTIRYSENYVRYVPDKNQAWNPQAASAAVKCNPGTSGFVQESVCEWDHLQQNRQMEYSFETFHYCNSVFILGVWIHLASLSILIV